VDVGDTLPQATPEHPAPLTVQLTPLFAESFATVAVRICACPASTVADGGVTLTAIAAGGVFEALPAQPDRNPDRNKAASKKGAIAR